MPTGRSVAFTRAAWAEVGGFPENLPTGEDVTFGMRIAARHPALLVADAAVEWEQRPSIRSTLRMYYRYGQGSADSGNTRLVVRDGLRLVAYGGGAVLATRGPLAQAALAVGAVGYLGVPVQRAVRGPYGARAAALVPFATAARAPGPHARTVSSHARPSGARTAGETRSEAGPAPTSASGPAGSRRVSHTPWAVARTVGSAAPRCRGPRVRATSTGAVTRRRRTASGASMPRTVHAAPDEVAPRVPSPPRRPGPRVAWGP